MLSSSNHVNDALKACDHAVLLKRLVKNIAYDHEMDTTFMAKPYPGQAGNGLHVHISLLDKHGNNIFTSEDPEQNAALRHAIGGAADRMAQCGVLLGILAGEDVVAVLVEQRDVHVQSVPSLARIGLGHEGGVHLVVVGDVLDQALEQHRIVAGLHRVGDVMPRRSCPESSSPVRAGWPARSCPGPPGGLRRR